MYAKTKKLKVSCPTNPDYNAVFNKEDIENEMREIGMTGNWIEYVLDHMFANEPDLTDDLLNIFNLYNLRKATLQFGDDYVTIEKLNEMRKRVEKLDNEYVCCICGKTFSGYGNNPYPVSKNENDRCCDQCYLDIP